MKARTRTRTRVSLSGDLNWNPPNAHAGPFTFQVYYKEIQDYYDKIRRFDGSLPPSDLYLFEEKSTPPFAGYLKQNELGTYTYQEGKSLPCNYKGTGKNWVTNSEWAGIEKMSESALVAKLLAETNPFRYEVSVPIMIWELTEAAALLSVNASNLFSLVGSGYLNWIFGIKPMMSDIRTMLSITKKIESRVREFNSLVRAGGLRRKITLERGRQTYNGAGGSAWSTYGVSISFSRVEANYSSTVYGSVRWRPKRGKEIEVSRLAEFNKAAAIVLDLQNPDPSTIWEAIPFSWLVDYFVNVGSTLQALERSDLVEPYDICIMRHRKVSTVTYLKRHSTLSGGIRTTVTGSDGVVNQEFKLRKVVSTPTGYTSLLRFGILSQREAINIIALLWALKGHRR